MDSRDTITFPDEPAWDIVCLWAHYDVNKGVQPLYVFRHMQRKVFRITCAVCLEDIADNEEIATGGLCEHMMHYACAETAVVRDNRCPSCRMEFVVCSHSS